MRDFNTKKGSVVRISRGWNILKTQNFTCGFTGIIPFIGKTTIWLNKGCGFIN